MLDKNPVSYTQNRSSEIEILVTENVPRNCEFSEAVNGMLSFSCFTKTGVKLKDYYPSFILCFCFCLKPNFSASFNDLKLPTLSLSIFGRHFRPFFSEKYLLKIHRFIHGFVGNTKYISNLYLDTSVIFYDIIFISLKTCCALFKKMSTSLAPFESGSY